MHTTKVICNDNAKAAVRAFADYIGQSDKCERYLEHIAPKKTVADAVEGKKIDISEMRDGMTVKCVIADSGCYKVGSQYTVGRDEDGYFGPLNEKGLASFNHQAYSFELIEDGEQKGEKWTHTWNRDKCRVVFTEGDSSWIKGHYISTIVLTERLKPIKPTLSKAEAWSKMHEKAKYNKNYGLAIQQIKEKYDII